MKAELSPKAAGCTSRELSYPRRRQVLLNIGNRSHLTNNSDLLLSPQNKFADPLSKPIDTFSNIKLRQKQFKMPAPVALPEPFASIPKSDFLFGSSPVHHLPRISEALGGKVSIWAKREDCNSGIAFGGNKTRKLEYLPSPHS